MGVHCIIHLHLYKILKLERMQYVRPIAFDYGEDIKIRGHILWLHAPLGVGT